MNGESDIDERGFGDILAFVLAHVGMLLGIGGVLVSSPHIAIAGLVLGLLGLLPFALKRD